MATIMNEAHITLTTDFGEDGPYVAAVKGAILSVNPAARILDLSHQIPPQDLWHAAFFLAHSLPFFPAGVIHVVVVDPGVGTERAVLYVEASGLRLLVPDNGCWTPLVRPPAVPSVRRLAEPRYWRPAVSSTFHGRDIFAPVAGWLSRGLDPERLGPLSTNWARLDFPTPEAGPDGVSGQVVFVDRFGNLITNIPAAALTQPPSGRLRVTVGSQEVSRQVRAYAEAEPGALVALIGSAGTVEVAVNRGSAAERLRAGLGARVKVTAVRD